jgi:hypothetical protein
MLGSVFPFSQSFGGPEGDAVALCSQNNSLFDTLFSPFCPLVDVRAGTSLDTAESANSRR